MENVGEIDNDTENIIITISLLLYIEIIQTDETPQNFNSYETKYSTEKKNTTKRGTYFSFLFPVTH